MRAHLDRIEHEQAEQGARITAGRFDEEDGLILENPIAVVERARPFAVIKGLLTAAELGTS
jgi:hypothetical protein